MAIDRISVGTSPNDDTGSDLRETGLIINQILDDMWDTITGGVAYLLGKVSIGTATPSHKLTIESVSDDIVRIVAKGTGFGGTSIFEVYSERTSTTTNALMNIGSAFSIDAFIVETSGEMLSLPSYNNVTGSAANMFIDSNGRFFRSSSSERLKTDIEPISSEYSNNIYRIAKEAAIFYKSLCAGDNPEWTMYGLSAEKLAEIDPRLVHFGYWPEDYEILIRDIEVEEIIKGEKVKIIKEEKYKAIKKDVEMTPVGVQETKIIPLMLIEMDKMNDRMNDLENRLAALN